MYQFSSELGLKDIEVLIRNATSKTFNKKELLIKEGSTKNEVFFIRKCLMYCLYTTI